MPKLLLTSIIALPCPDRPPRLILSVPVNSGFANYRLYDVSWTPEGVNQTSAQAEIAMITSFSANPFEVSA